MTRGGFSRLGGIETPPAPAPLEGMQGGPPLSLLGPSQEVRSDTDTGQMEAAAGERHLSPELALVDPDTAAAARAQLPDGSLPPLGRSKSDAPVPGSDWEAAVRRIAEHSSSSDFDEPSPKLRLPKVGLATVTWTLATFLALDARLYDWSTWIP